MKKTKHSYQVKVSKKEGMSPEEIACLRKQTLNISQGLFADLLGVSTRAVTSWECGWRKPSASTLTILKFYQRNPHIISEKIGVKK